MKAKLRKKKITGITVSSKSDQKKKLAQLLSHGKDSW
jgi:hypothetical protein